MQAVGLIEPGLGGHALQEKRIQRHPECFRQIRIDGVEPCRIIGAVIGRGDHAAQQDRDLARLQRLAIDAIAQMSDADLAAVAGAPPDLARALRGARTLVEAREIAAQILQPAEVTLGTEAEPTLARFVELRRAGGEHLEETDARAVVRELKAVGGNLKFLRLALTGAERGPELWTVVAAVPREEALRRTAAAITPR